MLLQGAGRHVAAWWLLDGAAHDWRLVLAKSEQHDASGIQNRSHAHGDGLPRHIPFAKKVAGRIASCHAIQRDETRAAFQSAAWLVESDVPGAANTEQLQVDPPGFPNHFLIPNAGGSHLLARQRAVGNVNRVGRNIDVVKQMLPHEATVALEGVGLDRPVFVEVERNNSLKRHALLAVQADELVVDSYWRATCGQAQHRCLTNASPRLNQFCDLAGYGPAGIAWLVVHRDRHSLTIVQRIQTGLRVLCMPMTWLGMPLSPI